MVSSPVIVGIIAATAIGVLIIISAYSLSIWQSNSDYGTAQQQESHIVIAPKTYPSETWGNANGFDFTANKSIAINTTLELDYCARINEENFVMLRGVDSENPVILKRNRDEVSIPFCLFSLDSEPVTWELIARDNRHQLEINEFEVPEMRVFDHGALMDGVKLSFDKSTVSFPGEPFDPNNLQRNSGNFTLFLDTDVSTKLGDKGFYVMAIRHLDDIDREVQVSSIIVYVRVID